MTFAAPPAATLDNIRQQASRLVDIENTLEEMKTLTAQLTTERHHIRQVELPRMMQELSLTSVGIGNHKVELAVLVEASLPKDPAKRMKALSWLIQHGHGGAIRRLLSVDLPKDNDALVEQAVDVLESISLTPTVDHSVHPQSYKALCREIVTSGEAAPLEDLGIFVGQIAKVEQ